MKKMIRILLMLTLSVVLLCGGAMAAGNPITVQLDGQQVVFPDAQPRLKGGRTYVPVRAVAETMGADVSYDGETRTVTIVRGERTITMTLGSDQLTITEGGESTTSTMDAAPFLYKGRTYVPIRFAAQALDCMVGWESDSRTVVIVDTEKLVTDVLAGKSFTYLEKLAALSGKYSEGIWDMGADVSAGVSFDLSTSLGNLSMPLLTMEGTTAHTIQDSDKQAMDMNMKVDMTTLLALAGGELPEEAAAMLEVWATEGVDLSMRMDMTAGTLYMNMAAAGLDVAGLDPTVWYKLDLTDMMGQTGMDALAMGGTLDLVDSLNAQLSASEVLNSTAAYTEIKAMAEELCAGLADDSFQLDEDGWYTLSYSMDEEGTAVEYALSLALTDDTLEAYEMVAVCQVEQVTIMAQMAMTDDGEMAFALQLSLALTEEQMTQLMEGVQLDELMGGMQLSQFVKVNGGAVTCTMVMECAYTEGTTAPETEPPAGATIMDMNDLDELAGVMTLPEEV